MTNREILFRGFHESENRKETIYIDGREIKGKWVYGDLVKCMTENGECVGIKDTIYEVNTYRCNLIPTIVIPETIGQYTGLTDKNGKKIFEGNIVKAQPYSDRPYSAKAKSKQHIGVVYYHIRHFKNIKYQQNYEALEVIGNIFSNPELLRSDYE